VQLKNAIMIEDESGSDEVAIHLEDAACHYEVVPIINIAFACLRAALRDKRCRLIAIMETSI